MSLDEFYEEEMEDEEDEDIDDDDDEDDEDEDEDEDEGFSYRLALNAMQFDRKDAAVPGSKSNFIWQPSIGLRYDINDLYVGLDAAARFASASIYDPTLEVPEDALSPIREGNIILNFGYNYDDKLEFGHLQIQDEHRRLNVHFDLYVLYQQFFLVHLLFHVLNVYENV